MRNPIGDIYLMRFGIIPTLEGQSYTLGDIIAQADNLRSFWQPEMVCKEALITAPRDIKLVKEKKLITLGSDGMGNLYMISDDNQIYFWDHELGWGKDENRFGFEIISDSVEEFLNSGAYLGG